MYVSKIIALMKKIFLQHDFFDGYKRSRPASKGMKRGSSLTETIIYISILTIVFVIFMRSTLSLVGSYAQLKAIRDLDTAALVSMERITREIRAASTIDAVQSVLNSNPGKIVINQIDSSGNTTQVGFSVVGSGLDITIGGVDKGNLLPGNVSVTNLQFGQINTSNSSAINVDLTLIDSRGKIITGEKYHSTVIMRGSYR